MATAKHSHTTEHRYQLKLNLCPVEYLKAHFYSGDCSWRESAPYDNRSYDYEGISLWLSSVKENGNKKHPTCADWEIFAWFDNLREARLNSWLIPTDLDGSTKIYSNKKEAEEAILRLADLIYESTGGYPTIEAIRLEKNGENKQLRLYSFFFCCEPGCEPYIDSEVCC